MPFNVRPPFGLVFLTVVASFTTLAAIIWGMTHFQGRNQTPADILPADSTVALVHYPLLPELEEPVKALFPILQSAPHASGSIVAVLRLPDEPSPAHWIVFTPDTQPQEGDNQGFIGRYFYRASDVKILEQLGHEMPLSHDAFFSVIEKEDPSDFLYLRTDALPETNTLTDRITHAMLKDTKWISMSRGADAYVIKLAGSFKDFLGADFDVSHSDDAKEILALNDGASLWDFAKSAVTSDDAALLESAMLQSIRDHFGDDVSLQYDLLPLLQKPSMLSVSSSGGFLFAGSADTATLKATLLRLHASVRSVLPRITINQYEIGQFSANVVMEDQGGITEETWSQDGYEITRTGPRNGSGGFLTAVRNNDFFISNDRNLLEEALKAPPSFPFSSNAPMDAGGIISSERIEPLRGAPLFSLFPPGKSLLWSLVPVDRSLKLLLISW